MQDSDTAIPAEYVQFCKEVAKLAAQYQMERLGLTLRPGFNSPWREEIQMNWSAGRHGDDAHRLVVSSTLTVRTEVA